MIDQFRFSYMLILSLVSLALIVFGFPMLAAGVSVRIGQTGPPFDDGTIQGGITETCITIEDDSLDIGGFDFLVAYDHAVLSFLGATEGSIFSEYEWEYFTYRYGPSGACPGGCPNGVIRLLGFAEQNDGAHHPLNTTLQDGDSFCCLTFLVSNDRNLECTFLPISWAWFDCSDNLLFDPSGAVAFMSSQVLDFVGSDTNSTFESRADITDQTRKFPTTHGAPVDCDTVSQFDEIERNLVFKNGGITITCVDSVKWRGDINLNGMANEIADAVMFTEYFVKGLLAFGAHADGSIAASEVNGDEIPLTVADLVYLIRIITGDALPLPRGLGESTATRLSVLNGRVDTDSELGAILLIFELESEVDLLATEMDLKTGVVDGKKHALIFSLDGQTIATGPIVSATGNLLSADVSDYNGVVIDYVIEKILGDINVNGFVNESADVEMFIEYFVNGIEAFGNHSNKSIEASDVNGDGASLTIADLVYLIRRTYGVALKKELLDFNQALLRMTSKNGFVHSPRDLGAIHFEFEGFAKVNLLDSRMIIHTGSIDGNTHAVIYPPIELGNTESIRSGDVVWTNGKILKIEASDPNGAPLGASIELPETFALYQNFPNPFNPVTTIRFDLTEKVDAKVEIYNVSGQMIESFSGPFAVGRNEVVWSAENFASGVYIYKVTAGVNSQSRKMVLLK